MLREATEWLHTLIIMAGAFVMLGWSLHLISETKVGPDDFVYHEVIAYDSTMAAPLFEGVRAKLCVEALNEGGYIVYWPAPDDSLGRPRIAYMRVEAAWGTMTQVAQVILHGDPSRFYPENRPGVALEAPIR